MDACKGIRAQHSESAKTAKNYNAAVSYGGAQQQQQLNSLGAWRNHDSGEGFAVECHRANRQLAQMKSQVRLIRDGTI